MLRWRRQTRQVNDFWDPLRGGVGGGMKLSIIQKRRFMLQ